MYSLLINMRSVEIIISADCLSVEECDMDAKLMEEIFLTVKA